MVDGAAVKEIAGLVKEPKLVKVGGKEMVLRPDGTLHHVPLQAIPLPGVLELSTLSALVGYVAANRDQLAQEQLVLHVQSPQVVELVGRLEGEQLQRRVYARATCFDLGDGFLDGFLSQMQFNVGLLTRFADVGPRDDRAALLQLSTRIKDEQSTEFADDGRTQNVTLKRGVHLVEQANLPNPQQLTPYRTFREVDQVTSPFVWRVQVAQGLPTLGLFCADGGAWQLDAVARVKEWLEKHAPAAIPVLA